MKSTCVILSILVASGAASWLDTKPATQAFWARTRAAVTDTGAVEDLREQLHLADLAIDEFFEETEVETPAKPEPAAMIQMEQQVQTKTRLVAMAESEIATSKPMGEDVVKGLLGESSGDAEDMKLAAMKDLVKLMQNPNAVGGMVEGELKREKAAEAKREQFVSESMGKDSIDYFGMKMPLMGGVSKDKNSLFKLYDQLQSMKDGSSTDWMFPPPQKVAELVAVEHASSSGPSSMLQTSEGSSQRLVAMAESEIATNSVVAEELLANLAKPQGDDANDMKNAALSSLMQFAQDPNDIQGMVNMELKREKDADKLKDKFIAETMGKNSFNYLGQEMPLLGGASTSKEVLGKLYDQLAAIKDGSGTDWMFPAPHMSRVAEQVTNEEFAAERAKAAAKQDKKDKKDKKSSLLQMTESKLSAAPAEFRRTLKQWEKLGKDVLDLLLNEPDERTETQATDLVARAEAAQVELKGVYSTQLLDLAQTRVVASAVKQASDAIKARGTGETFKSDCSKLAKEDQCTCVMDAVCSYTAAGHTENKVHYCNLLVNAACLPQVNDV